MRTSFFLLLLSFVYFSGAKSQATLASEKPNILWITSEDNGPFLGCYGDEGAFTPNLDALAERGVRFTNCFANAPVCAPTRSSWILGTPAITTGTFQMRSWYRVPDLLRPYPLLLKDAGYYVTNNSKTDYNTSSFNKEIWDECSNQAHYKNRPEGQPFFAVFNTTLSHEGQIFPEHYPDRYPEAKTPAENIKIPPYQVSTPEVIRDWRRAYDRIRDMDSYVGDLIEELESEGEAENTIIVYNSDHGGITLRSKRFLFDSGTRVPFIVYVPEKWKHLFPHEAGSVSERLTQFIDMPKTFLSIAGAEVPDHMSGNIFMGPEKEKPGEVVLLFSGRFDESPDMSRAVTDGRWKYIRNYEPDRPRFQILAYPLRQEGQVSQYKEYRAGRTDSLQSEQYQLQPAEELYDTQQDPHEINNLAGDVKYSGRLDYMRVKMNEKMLEARDLGLIPEPLMESIDADPSTTLYEYGQSDANYPLNDLIQLANISIQQKTSNIPVFKKALKSKNACIRYQAALGLRLLGKKARPALADIEKALMDSDPSVRITAAICLGNLDCREEAVRFLLEEAKRSEGDIHVNWALNGIAYLGEEEHLKGLPAEDFDKGEYSGRVYNRLIKGGNMYKMTEE